MVLTFSDWSNYVDEAGSPRTIDWDNLRGTPRAAVTEAIRQAMLERAGIVSDVGTMLNVAGVAYPGAEMLADPIRVGVDMDGVRKLQALEYVMLAIAGYYLDPSFEAKATTFWAAGVTDSWFAWDPQYWVVGTARQAANYVQHDPLSSAWATSMKHLIDCCTVTYAMPPTFSGSVLPLVYHSPPTWYASGSARAIGSLSSEQIRLGYAHATWAEFVASFAAMGWGASASPMNPHYYWYDGPPGFAWRGRRHVAMAASDLAREVSISADYRGASFPEGQPSAGWNLDAVFGASMDAQQYVFRDSKLLPSARPPTSIAWVELAAGSIRSNWAVPGGFTFQE